MKKLVTVTHFAMKIICTYLYITCHSFILLACAEFDNSLPFSGASSIPLWYVLFPATLPHQLFHPLTPSCHLFLGLPLNLLVPRFIYSTALGILFSSILCTCPNQRRYSNYGVLISKKGINTRSVMSVCPHGKPLLPLDGFSWNLVSEDLSKHLSRDVKGDENLTEIPGTLHADLSTFVIISPWIVLKMRNVSDKVVEKIKTNNFIIWCIFDRAS